MPIEGCLNDEEGKMKMQKGFTLIELIVVIVILGILAATAIPRFLDVASNARKANLSGAQGAMNSASNLAHAAQQIAGTASNVSVTLGGQTVTMSGGYPTADSAGIGMAATINTAANGDYTLAGSNPFVIQPINGGSATCQVSYANTGTGTFTITVTPTGC
jgi:MSHA pilin protein MshA